MNTKSLIVNLNNAIEEPCSKTAGYLNVWNFSLPYSLANPHQAAVNALAIRFNNADVVSDSSDPLWRKKIYFLIPQCTLFANSNKKGRA